jgi:threonine dehydrogenase-like Zn-dependent dehydrogenase
VARRHGKTNCCQPTGVLSVHVDGGKADYIRVPERKQREHKLSTNGGKL